MLWYRGHEMSCFSAISDVRFLDVLEELNNTLLRNCRNLMFDHFVKNSRHFGIGINKPHYRGAGYVELTADVGDGFAFAHESQDFILIGEENLNLRALTRTPSELDAGGFSDGEGLLGAHGD